VRTITRPVAHASAADYETDIEHMLGQNRDCADRRG
jgi:hypothetical protein